MRPTNGWAIAMNPEDEFQERFLFSLFFTGPTRGQLVFRDPDGTVLDADKFDLASRRSREAAISGFAQKFGWSETDVNAFRALLIQVLSKQVAKSEQGKRELDWFKTRDEEIDKIPAKIRAEAEHQLADGNLLRAIFGDVRAIGVAGERWVSLAVYLVGTSRLLANPLHGIMSGPSSSGKSFILEKVATLFPSCDVVYTHDMTPQALYYMPAGGLKHKFVVKGERTRKEATQAGHMELGGAVKLCLFGNVSAFALS
jgi:hypothetical protein